MGKGLVAKELGLLLTQLEDAGDDSLVVVLVVVVATVDVAEIHLLAQLTVVGILQEGNPAGLVQGEEPSLLAGCLSSLASSVDGALGQTCEVLLVGDDELEGVGLGQGILAKLDAGQRELLVNLHELGLLLGIEQGTTFHKHTVVFVEHHLLLTGKAQ